ncbi:MAG TPA: lysophospholipid acyltransferase family protein [Amaricoccus sp.]|nr:lysophospholipid acyltransferase family protein [Amaricoccus sp.]
MSGAGSYLAWLPQAALLGVARALPYRARLALGSAVLRTAVAVVPDLRGRVDNNLGLIFPDMPAAERGRIRRGMADSFGRTLIETVTVPQFHARAAWSEPSGPGWEPFLAAHAEGRGALLVSGHFGQWEAVRGMLKARGIEAGALYRPVKNPHLQAMYFEQMSLSGAPLFPRSRQGMRELVRHLKSGGVVCVLLDQYVQGGRPIEFLGHPAPTGLAIAELAVRFDVPMIPAYGTREPDGLHVRIDFEPPLPRTSAEAMTQAAADSLSARVLARPEQYYWLHRRWIKQFA